MLARALGDRGLMAKAEGAALATIASMEQAGNYRWCGDIIAVLMLRSRAAHPVPPALGDVTIRAVAHLATRIEAHPHLAPVYFDVCHNYLALRRRLLKAQQRPEEDQRSAHRQRATLYEEQAAHALAHRVDSPHLLAADALLKALPIYQELGDSVKVAALKRRIQAEHKAAREGEHFRPLGVTGTLDCSWIDDLTARLSPIDPVPAFVAGIATACIPKSATIRQNMRDAAAANLLAS